MAKWQPPIPAGAMYSKAARALGPALPLLAYCYDLVQRDGWLDLDLTEAAGDMEEPYPTVKRWWKIVKAGPFFCEAIDRGRRGWRVRFRDVWVDLRILSTRPAAKDISRTNEGSEMILEEIGSDQSVAQGHFKDISRTNEGSEMILETPAYKVLNTTDQAEIAEPRKTRPASAIQKRQTPDCTPEHRAYLDRKKAIEQAYVAELAYTPAAFGKEAKSSKWLAEQGYTPEQVVKCYRHLQSDEFYAKQHISLAIISKQIGAWVKLKSSSNGHTNGVSPTRQTYTPPPADVKPPQEVAAQMKALIAQQRGK